MSPAEPTRRAEDRSSESTAAGIPWYAFARVRGPFLQRWPSVFRIPLLYDHYSLFAQRGVKLASLLDIGATDRVHEDRARTLWPGIDYRSFDIDRTNRHDYHDFADIDRQFDAVTLIEVLEHVPPTVAYDLAKQCFASCKPGGWLLASVPNVYTPGAQDEWTHISALHYSDLFGLMAWAGFEVVAGARIYHSNLRHRLVHARLLHALHRLMGVDYAQSVAVLARKPLG